MFLSNYFHPQGPGAALGIAVPGENSIVECVGVSDLRDKLPITLDTSFDLASASKIFTAAAVMLLAEESRLAINDPLKEYMPALRSNSHSRLITLQDLLWHTSGLPDYLESGRYTPESAVTPDWILEKLNDWSLGAKPGMVHNYSNTNYFLLSQVIEVVAKESYQDFVRTRLFAPLGLENTFVGNENQKGKGIAKGYQDFGYGVAKIRPSEEFEIITLGDGGVFSSVNDLLEWTNALWMGEIVSAESLGLMQARGRLDSGEAFEYGFGLQLESAKNGETWCGHGGSWMDSTVMIGQYMPEACTVIVLSNEVMAPVERISKHARLLVEG